MKGGWIMLSSLVMSACAHRTHLSTSTHATTMFDSEGHRGCRGLMPENTIPAMLHALDLGVTTLEMDACITKDGKVIISHEPFFSHDITTKNDGSFIDEKEERNYKLYQMTYAETLLFDVGMKPNPRFPKQKKIPVHKPLLSDLLDSVQHYMTRHDRASPYFNIETKTTPATDNIFHPGPAAFVDLLMDVVRKKGIEKQVIIQSFDFRTLRYLHTAYPGIRTAMLIEGTDKRTLEEQLRDLGFVPDIYSPAYELVNDALIRNCHGKKIQVIPWTVNDKPTINSLKNAGVDGIISDYPDLF